MESFKEEERLNKIDEKNREILDAEVSVNNLTFRLLNIKHGDLVFCSSLNSSIICDQIICEGAEPVFIDSEYNSLNMSIVALKKAFKYYSEIGRLPRAVIASQFYGKTTNINKIVDICNEYNVPIIEDATEFVIENFDEKIEKKKYIYEYYEETFKDIDEIEVKNIYGYDNPNYTLSIVRLSQESKVKPIDIISVLEGEGIEAMYICKPMHIQDCYKNYNFFSSYSYHGISVAEDVFSTGICLLSNINMSKEAFYRVILKIKNIF